MYLERGTARCQLWCSFTFTSLNLSVSSCFYSDPPIFICFKTFYCNLSNKDHLIDFGPQISRQPTPSPPEFDSCSHRFTKETCEVSRIWPTPGRGHPLHQQNPKTQYPGKRHLALHFLSQLVAEVAGTITWRSQSPQKCFSKRIPNFRPSVTRLAWNLCEGVLPWLGFQSSQAFF